MNHCTTIALATLITAPLAAQQVICAAGQEHANATRSITFTLGEPVNTTATGSTATLTQGFNQPWADITTTIGERTDDGISVYPNPTRHLLYVDHAAHVDGEHFVLLNAAGARVKEGAVNGRITTLNMEHCASGGYFLKLLAPDRKTLRTFKISVTR